VNPVEVEDYTTRKWKKLDEAVETRYIHAVNTNCEQEHMQQRRMVDEAQGWFYPDLQKMNEARNMPMPNCRRLQELGIRY
jgi:DnaJ family protein B protein 12